MHPSAMAFVCSALTAQDVERMFVLEVGSMDVNGSVRPHVESLGPAAYEGSDMRPGNGVDLVCDVADLPARYSDVDVIISTEMLEHAADWQGAMKAMIGMLRPGGILVLTTRSAGFPLHAFPDDHWRFPVKSMREILAAAGLTVERCEPDPEFPGVFARARKPDGWSWPDVQAAWDATEVTRP